MVADVGCNGNGVARWLQWHQHARLSFMPPEDGATYLFVRGGP